MIEALFVFALILTALYFWGGTLVNKQIEHTENNLNRTKEGKILISFDEYFARNKTSKGN